MRFAGFCGPAYESRSVIAAAQTCRNWYPEHLETDGEDVRAVLYPTPGLAVFVALAQGPVRAMFGQDGRGFAVSGGRFYEVFANGTSTERGLVAAGSLASICSNGTAGGQLLIVSGGFGYIFTLITNVFTQITDVDFPSGLAAMADFSDGYFFVLRAGSRAFHLSTLEDGTAWRAVDLAEVSHGSDNLVSFLIDQRLLWLFGSKTTEIWYNSGNADFPFEPLAGVFLQEGIASPWARGRLGTNSVYWVASGDQGAGVVHRAVGYTPTRVSTHAIERRLQTGASLSDLECWTYQDDGHLFAVITAPLSQQTWVFDAITGAWHERSWWNVDTGQPEHIRARCHMYLWGHHLVGDRVNGNVYRQSLALYDDNGTRIHRVRRSPHLRATHQQMFYHRFGLTMDVGVGNAVAPDVDPQIELRYSDDGAMTWSDPRAVSFGTLGAYQTAVEWFQLGAGRDRVFEVSTSAQVPVRVVDAYLDASRGTH